MPWAATYLPLILIGLYAGWGWLSGVIYRRWSK